MNERPWHQQRFLKCRHRLLAVSQPPGRVHPPQDAWIARPDINPKFRASLSAAKSISICVTKLTASRRTASHITLRPQDQLQLTPGEYWNPKP